MKNNNLLESQVFGDNIARNAFGTILETLDHITPLFIERNVFDAKKGKFLETIGKDKFGEKYNLYLPIDFNNEDLFYIVFLLNEKFNLDTDIKRLIGYIKLAIGKIGEEEEIKALKTETQKKIDQIIQANNLDKNSYDKYQDMIESKNIFALRKAMREIGNYKSEKGSKKYQDTDLLESLYKQEFDLAFFKKGIHMLRYGLMTLTKADLKKIKEKGSDNKNIINTSKIDERSLDDEERKLRDKIKIDEYKDKLKQARDSGETKKVIRLETEVTNLIIHTLHTQYPYQITQDDYGYQPNKILEHKEIYCVGFSLVGHAFLSELGIHHNGMSIFEHSALEIIIGNDSFYFDPTGLSEIYKLEWKEELVYNNKKGMYKNFEVELIYNNEIGIYKNSAISGNPEKILLSLIYNNKGISLRNLGEICEDECNTEGAKKYFIEAIEMFDQALDIKPNNFIAYNNKGNSLFYLGNISKNEWNTKEVKKYFIEAIEMFDQALDIKPNSSNIYYNKGNSLFYLGNIYKDEGNIEEAKKYITEAIEMFNQALNINPKNSDVYNNKGSSLNYLGREKEANLYKFVVNLFEAQGNVTLENPYLKEKKNIELFFRTKQFSEIRDYLLSLEDKVN